ncbi:MAG TPA: carotenoid oxygenase family protein [Steroidobacteraceae bacterium]|jgi:carotenoid cleavage dioxygenase|nr:carotenoid oxygenase family protein [Steroidobacteraceae bacterium]
MDTIAIEPASNPHVSGNQAPVRLETTLEPKIRGKIPAELRGALYRNGPNPQFDPGPDYHAFFGDGMIHGFWLADGRARYANRYVRTPRWLAENAAGRALFGGLGLPSDPSVEKIASGGANTHIVHHAGKLMALQEGSNPFEMDSSDLSSKGWVETGGRFTAHPKTDPDSGEMLWFAYSAAETPLNPYLDYGISDASGRITRRDRFQAPYCSMVHDFLVTRNYTAFPVLPLTGDLERAKRGLPAFAWEPQKGAFVGLMARGASVDAVRWLEVDPVYVFHPANAYEQDGCLHCDMMEYPSAPLFPNPDGSPRTPVKARRVHWKFDLTDRAARVIRTPMSDLAGEFPRIDERFGGLPYRHCWHAANVEMKEALLFDSLAHVDLATQRETLRRFARGDSVGEPVFVPRSAQAAEGDGWILAVLHRAAEDRSDLLILNAQDISGEPEAVLELPCRVPAGFHGSWVGG